MQKKKKSSGFKDTWGNISPDLPQLHKLLHHVAKMQIFDKSSEYDFGSGCLFTKQCLSHGLTEALASTMKEGAKSEEKYKK